VPALRSLRDQFEAVRDQKCDGAIAAAYASREGLISRPDRNSRRIRNVLIANNVPIVLSARRLLGRPCSEVLAADKDRGTLIEKEYVMTTIVEMAASLRRARGWENRPSNQGVTSIQARPLNLF